jgi:hypothetical protein
MDVWAVQSFAEFWSPGHFIHQYRMVSTGHIPGLISATIQLPSCHAPRFIRLSAHSSPLREDLSVIWAYISSAHQEGLDYHTTTCKFSLILPPATPPQLHLRSSTCVEGNLKSPVYRDISYTGHTGIFDSARQVGRILAPVEPHGTTNGTLLGNGEPVHVSAYSGALTYATYDSIVVNYYQ